MSEPIPLVPWGKRTVTALIQQLQARARCAQALGDKHEYALVAVFVEKNERGNYEYTVTNTEIRPEQMLWAAHEITLRVEGP